MVLRRLLLLLCSALLLVITIDEQKTRRIIDDRVAPYVHEYIDGCRRLFPDCPSLGSRNLIVKVVYFEELLPPNIVGDCTITVNLAGTYRYIRILVTQEMSEWSIRATTWHEMHHCWLGMPHVGLEGVDVPLSERPFSLMDWQGRDPQFYRDNWDTLVHMDFMRARRMYAR